MYTLKYKLCCPFLVVPRYEEDIKDLAVNCLALLSYIHSSLWVHFLDGTKVDNHSSNSRSSALLLSVKLLLGHVEVLIQIYLDTLSHIRNLPTNTYAGFDERDVKEYNLSDYDAELARERETKMQALCADKDDAEATLRTYLMLVFQVFAEPIPAFRSLPTDGGSAPPSSSVPPRTPTQHRSNPDKNKLVDTSEPLDARILLAFVDSLLGFSKKLEEEGLYALCVHAIAAIDQQVSVSPQSILSPVSSPRSPRAASAEATSQRSATQCCTTPVAAWLATAVTRTHTDLPTVCEIIIDLP